MTRIHKQEAAAMPEDRGPGSRGTMHLAELLALSDERDAHLRRSHQAFREGWRAARLAHAYDYSRGYVDGLLRRKHLEHDAVEAARIELARWGPGGRERFGDPRTGDYAGGAGGVAGVRDSWLAGGHDLGPGAGWVHLGGRGVHYHQCKPACSAYEPGFYTPAAAAAILQTLPGDYAAAIAELRAMAGTPRREAA